ncbi:MAG TPA: hydrogenase maturation protein [Ramlibacter sp.]|uniref:hydrogenase maturation protein n=1 Tax=Ramlibacter sp. TaxID=1917967 RepID=UPI002D7E5069|nr:hydrogenase maturation protein [Ramlibacter sp.]HET8746511.1 hydrogenase maturation protein [Ramlibacter sp.]
MRILLLAHAFNSLTQRLWAELQARGHTLSIEFDIADAVTEEAVALFEPDLVLAPYLRRAIPEPVWGHVRCLVVHPGIVGDRGPSALDWALQEGEARWGVTVLQAEAEMDAGPVWASVEFPLRAARKSSVYRNEVSAAALHAVLLAIERIEGGSFIPTRPEHVPGARGRLRLLMRQADRAIDWTRDGTEAILRRIRAADGFPGVADRLFGEACHLYDAWPEARLRGAPGAVIARRETALLRATVDGAVWIGHVKRAGSIKLPAVLSFPEQSAALPEAPLAGWWRAAEPTWQDIAYEEQAAVGVLHFEFYNGAMSTAQCERLRNALLWARARPVRVLVLAGGQDFWSNGIHLNAIEAESLQGGSAADASWRNIQAIDDLALELITTESQLTVAALAGNAGAGGCFLARAADYVWAREAVLLNPHYRNMGNLYGSEYWTYLLPKRLGAEGAQAVMRNRQPLTARAALASGFIDECIAGDAATFAAEVARRAAALAADPAFAQRLADKRAARAADEAAKPLAAYRAEELAQMRRNFYGFDPSYHVARHHFVHKSPASWTPRHLARHRELAGRTA